MKEVKKEKKKTGNILSSIFVIITYLLIGFFCGFAMSAMANTMITEKTSLLWDLFAFAISVAATYAAFVLIIAIHEAGHLLFGLLTGYTFLSFRVLSFMIVKEGERYRFCRYSLAGTGGQCLMAPPELKDGKMPYVLYNLGGVILNGISAIIGVFLFFLIRIPFASYILLTFAVLNIWLLLTNGIPMRMGVDNDGYNAMSLGKKPSALKAFWVQMKVTEYVTKGVRLKDMPDELFLLPTDEEMNNTMCAAQAVFLCNRLLDEGKREEAITLINKLTEEKNAISDLHKKLLYCDKITLLLLGGKADEAALLLTREQKSFMAAMKKFLSVIRTEYAIAVLKDNNSASAKLNKEAFERSAKKYPYTCDIESEREIIGWIDEAKQIEE